MANGGLFSTVTRHRLRALDRFLPDGDGVVVVFPNRSTSRLCIVMGLSSQETARLEHYPWHMPDLPRSDRERLLSSLKVNDLPANLVGDIDRTIDRDNRLEQRAAEKGKTHNSSGGDSALGFGCFSAIVVALLIVAAFGNADLDGGWSFVALLLAAGAGALVMVPFWKASSARSSAASDYQTMVAEILENCLQVDPFIDALALKASGLDRDLRGMDGLGLETEALRVRVSSIITDILDNSLMEMRELERYSQYDDILKGISEEEAQADEDLSMVSEKRDAAMHASQACLTERESALRDLDRLGREIGSQRRIGEAKLRAVRNRYEDGGTGL